MKRLILLAMLIPALCLASGWDLYQGPIFSDAILPISSNSGQVGTSANAYNSMYADSFITNPTFGGTNSWTMIKSGSTQGGSGLYISDSTSGQSRVVATITYNRAAATITMDRGLSVSNAAGITTTGDLFSTKSGGRASADTLKGTKAVFIGANGILSMDTTAALSTVFTFTNGRTVTISSTKGP
jgi:hypothetical protein